MVPADPGRLLPGQRTVPLTEHDALRRRSDPAVLPCTGGGLRHPGMVGAGGVAGLRPAEAPGIPQRDHEPRGRESIGFTRFSAPWLRAGLQWFGKSVLETGQMAWSTLLQRVGAMTEFDAFLAGRGSFPPHLADDPAAVRALMRDYLAHVSTRRVGRGTRAGEPISASQRKILVICVEQFYAFMHD